MTGTTDILFESVLVTNVIVIGDQFWRLAKPSAEDLPRLEMKKNGATTYSSYDTMDTCT